MSMVKNQLHPVFMFFRIFLLMLNFKTVSMIKDSLNGHLKTVLGEMIQNQNRHVFCKTVLVVCTYVINLIFLGDFCCFICTSILLFKNKTILRQCFLDGETS